MTRPKPVRAALSLKPLPLITKADVPATYASEDSLKKTIDDLIGVGIPQEQINVTRSDMQIKVITPKACEQEIRSLLKRHNPIKYNSSCKYCDYLTI